MSARESSDGRRAGIAQYTRWPGLLSLALGVLLGPTIALANQQLIYASDMYACGRGFHGVLHIIPALCLVVVIGTGVAAYVNWREIGKGVEDEHEGIAARVRFLALLGMAISALSALVILAQWLSIFVFQPCMRA